MRFLNIKPENLTNLVKTSTNAVTELKNKILTDSTNQLVDFANLDAETTRVSNYLYLCKNFSTDEEVRKIASDLNEAYTKDMIDLTTDNNLYKVLETYKIPISLSNWHKHLYERFRIKNLQSMKRSGLHLNQDTMDKVKDISKRLTELSSKFSTNVNEFKETLKFTRQELEGMPETWFVDSKKLDVKEDMSQTTYEVTTQYPDVLPVQDFCKNRDVRRKVYQLFSTKCLDENKPILEETVLLRDQKAKLLGYKTHADLKTEDKVIKTSENAINFLESMNTLFSKNYKQELEELTNFAKEQGFEGDRLESWDRGYYMRLYREKKTDLDKEALRKKFPVKKAVAGMLDIYQELLGYKFVLQDEDQDKFHESVEVYKVFDKETNQEMGTFYLDLFTREGKYGHAAVFSLSMPHFDLVTGEKQLPEGMMACNFSEGNLYFSEVETLFHEFGHMMHLLSCKPENTLFSFFGSFGCEWDFVETPSQAFEYWCYEKEPLMRMSEGLTDDDIAKIRKNKNLLPTLHYKRQLHFGTFDMRLHSKSYDDNNLDTMKVWLDTERDVTGQVSPGTARIGNFSHIMGGYDAGYYGYLKSESMSANLFYVLFKGDEMNSTVGKKFREQFLGGGSTYDAVDLMKIALNLKRKEGEPELDIDDSWFIKSLEQ